MIILALYNIDLSRIYRGNVKYMYVSRDVSVTDFYQFCPSRMFDTDVLHVIVFCYVSIDLKELPWKERLTNPCSHTFKM